MSSNSAVHDNTRAVGADNVEAEGSRARRCTVCNARALFT